ncbi:MAG: sigma-70 family RNA polymerase sigma factor [Vicinamibacterales bacterium]
MPGEGQELTDADLLARAAGGNREAFAVLVARHQASVYRFARTLVARPADAEDVLQQTFLAAWTSAARFRAEASVRTWLFVIARNAAFSQRAREARRPETELPLDDLGMAAGWGSDDPETAALAAERRAALASAFEALPPADREVLTLRDLEGLSGDETAAVLGVSLPAMKSRLHRARLGLAARVREEVGRATR